MQLIKASFLKCSLAYRRVWVALKHRSLFLKQLITCLSAVAKFSAALLMFGNGILKFDTVWIDGILYKLFSELGIGGRMWKMMKDLYTNVKAQVLYAESLSRKINVSQGTGQSRILAPFMYKVYVNGLLSVLTNHCYAIFINGLRIPSPSFADDITLLALHPSFLKTFTSICYKFGIKWRVEFNHSKSGIVTFGESKPQHFESMKTACGY